MSFISNMLSEGQVDEETKYSIKWIASSLYTGKIFPVSSVNCPRC